MLADRVALGDRGDHRLSEVLRVGAGEADATGSRPPGHTHGAARRTRCERPGARSRPHELTFWPSSVISLTPYRASSATSATISPGLRLCSRPRTAGTMQYAHFELQPMDTCTQAWNRRSDCLGRSAAKCWWVPNFPRGTANPPAAIHSPRCGIDPGRRRRPRRGTARRSAPVAPPRSTRPPRPRDRAGPACVPPHCRGAQRGACPASRAPCRC